MGLDRINPKQIRKCKCKFGGLPIWCDMRAYTRAKLIRTKLKSVSVRVSFGEINSENKKGACKFFCCKGKVEAEMMTKKFPETIILCNAFVILFWLLKRECFVILKNERLLNNIIEIPPGTKPIHK